MSLGRLGAVLATFLLNVGVSSGVSLASLDDQSGLRPGHKRCEIISYIRIQKTGGSTLGEHIMPAMGRAYHQRTRGTMHYEFRKAKEIAHDCMITMLRNPVERFMSEFAMSRGLGRWHQYEDQWDWHEQDLEELRSLHAIRNDSEALLAYLRAPSNPARNRQALYLLGFDRVRCNASRLPPNSRRPASHGTAGLALCAEKPPYGYPARAYDWDADHDALVARAKEQLLKTWTFGVADCFPHAIKAMARALHWDPEESYRMAVDVHTRDKRVEMPATGTADTESIAPNSQMSSSQGIGDRWRDHIDQTVKEEIRNYNRVDEELVAFAKMKLYELHGLTC